MADECARCAATAAYLKAEMERMLAEMRAKLDARDS